MKIGKHDKYFLNPRDRSVFFGDSLVIIFDSF
ncbi:MAG: hypothetical protein JWR09_764 [Mucilaginibacter sp.]|nr:hypothetical protein [Mucilaginibacter sp.]